MYFVGAVGSGHVNGLLECLLEGGLDPGGDLVLPA